MTDDFDDPIARWMLHGFVGLCTLACVSFVAFFAFKAYQMPKQAGIVVGWFLLVFLAGAVINRLLDPFDIYPIRGDPNE